MKTTAFKLFYWAFEFVFWLTALSVLAVFIFYVFNFTGINANSFYTLSEDYKILNTDVCQPLLIENHSTQITAPQLQPKTWQIRFGISSMAHYVLLSFGLASVVYAFLILFIFRKFVHSLKQGLTFTFDNIKRLKLIGVLLLLITPLNWALKLLFENWLWNNIKLDNMLETSGRVGLSFDEGNILLNWFFVGLLVLVIAEVFNYGLKMKEEQDLTI